jgi:hypothetical protein
MTSFIKRTLWPWSLGAALVLGVWPAAQAQETQTWAPAHGASAPPAAPRSTEPRDWQDANQAVGQFRRGHVDLLRWEQKNQPLSPDAPLSPQAGHLTLERATQMVLHDQALWIKPNMSALEVAETRQQTAALRWAVQKLWVDAVVARQSAAHAQDFLTVAQAGAELGQRMAKIGNWSRARQIQEELLLWDAHGRLQEAQWQAERALNALWLRIGADMTLPSVAQQLPAHLPTDGPALHQDGQSLLGMPDAPALHTQALQANMRWRLDDTQAQRLMAQLGLSTADFQAAHNALSGSTALEAPVWNPRVLRGDHAFENAWRARLQADRLARQVRADMHMALRALQLAHQSAQQAQSQVLRLHTELSQETLLRYNGMLTSTWDLLASARTRIDSVNAALQAQRQLWLAQADVMAVLAGLPYAPSQSAMGSSSPSNTNKAGH